ncbi:pao retrotransposon peptidase [Lasius niger]|uniref:Pao retrotransposon peptidase n=1 Tax=Lasius niger TaxID=67767 RepID=A0A0J7K7U7_LASNI|nr:pao retrotransposon peptidase [Lasius niger]
MEFVRNRVTEIQDITEKNHWRHVRSEQNLADIILRGTDPDQLIKANIWWHGPEWLKNEEETANFYMPAGS